MVSTTGADGELNKVTLMLRSESKVNWKFLVAEPMPEPCEVRIRLEKKHAEAGAALDAARKLLQKKRGTTSKEEFSSLSRAVEQGWTNVQRARRALDKHVREHGCGIAGAATT